MCMKWKKRKRKEKRLIPSGKDKKWNKKEKKEAKKRQRPSSGFLLTDWLTGYSRNSNNTRSGSLECYATDWLSLGGKKKEKNQGANGQTDEERAWYSTVNTRVFLKEKDSSCGRCRLVQPHPNKTGNYQDGNPSSPREKFPSAHFSLFGFIFSPEREKRPSDRQSHLSVSTRKSLPPPHSPKKCPNVIKRRSCHTFHTDMILSLSPPRAAVA